MFGFVAGGSTAKGNYLYWGDGSDGTETWSGHVTKQGVYQFGKLIIADDAIVAAGNHPSGSNYPLDNGLVIFANQEIIIGDNVEIIAQRNSDSWRNSSSATSPQSVPTTDYGWNYGAGGGGCGMDGDISSTIYDGGDGNVPEWYRTENKGADWLTSSVLYEGVYEARSEGGGGRVDANAYNGDDSQNTAPSLETILKNNFQYTYRTVSGRDDFPVVKGGNGGDGGFSGNNGGKGGGTILLIAPKITFGSNVQLNAYGTTNGHASDGGSDATSPQPDMTDIQYWSTQLNGTGDYLGADEGGTGAGGGGGGGLVGVIYYTKTGTYTADVHGGFGGFGGQAAIGFSGGNGGQGGDGVAIDGQRPSLNTVDINWT
jgi:hypothetical protein